MAKFSIGEFDVDGRTYRVRAEGNDVFFSPYYFVNSVRDSVGQFTDLLTGDTITVNWQQIGVVRVIEVGR